MIEKTMQYETELESRLRAGGAKVPGPKKGPWTTAWVAINVVIVFAILVVVLGLLLAGKGELATLTFLGGGLGYVAFYFWIAYGRINGNGPMYYRALESLDEISYKLDRRD